MEVGVRADGEYSELLQGWGRTEEEIGSGEDQVWGSRWNEVGLRRGESVREEHDIGVGGR